jgi:hypothetical protein
MRRTKIFTVVSEDPENRDKGKNFLLTEMSAVQAEKWAARALLALLKSGIELPENAASAGLAGVAAVGIKAFGSIPWELAEPLLDEMMSCVRFIPPAKNVEPMALLPDMIEEVTTLLSIRKELLELHLGFSLAAKLSNLRTLVATKTGTDSSDTQTSPT